MWTCVTTFFSNFWCFCCGDVFNSAVSPSVDLWIAPDLLLLHNGLWVLFHVTSPKELFGPCVLLRRAWFLLTDSFLTNFHQTLPWHWTWCWRCVDTFSPLILQWLVRWVLLSPWRYSGGTRNSTRPHSCFRRTWWEGGRAVLATRCGPPWGTLWQLSTVAGRKDWEATLLGFWGQIPALLPGIWDVVQSLTVCSFSILGWKIGSRLVLWSEDTWLLGYCGDSAARMSFRRRGSYAKVYTAVGWMNKVPMFMEIRWCTSDDCAHALDGCLSDSQYLIRRLSFLFLHLSELLMLQPCLCFSISFKEMV